MPVDWEQIRRNRQIDEQPIRLSPEALAQAEKWERDQAAMKAEREHELKLKAAAEFFKSNAERAAKDNDSRTADVQAWAAASIERGLWPVHRTIASDPRITKFQSLRTELTYQGQTAQFSE